MDPNSAQRVIEKCGGHDVVAGWLKVSTTSVYRWTYPKDKGGTGGVIPQKHWQALIQKAASDGIELTVEDFFDPPAGDCPETAGKAA